ncbi:DivIVA domain-containing protein [Deinococcus hopiensis]|uniref:Cell division initiation protein n=1 Tax=Deinococcus hopiensis KR-140 TaxID=695939 RepID=A0A1W1VCP7_9DEIO|nr:DivIVA domain-containing protein [Deinococcus hopiensis]SMB90821.1 cell division initiation protein [Deinococcus hopiensis KR-140]
MSQHHISQDLTDRDLNQDVNPHPNRTHAQGALTPLDIGHRQFPGRPGGYDRASVRAFLGQIADQLEGLLHERQALRGRLNNLERELEERRQAEDEIRRAVVAAERIGHDLRENSTRQCELMLEQAQARRDAVERETDARAAELEAAYQVRSQELESTHQVRMGELESTYQLRLQELEHTQQSRMAELEAAFRGRFADLERDHHQLTLERDRAHAERTVYLERTFNERHTELSSRLSAVRTEYTQFVSQYRALVQSFAELSARHLPLGDDLPLPASPLPASPLPDALVLNEALDNALGEGLRLEEQSFA